MLEKKLIDLGQRVVESALKRGLSAAEAIVRESSHLSAKVRLGEPELIEEATSRSIGLRVFADDRSAITSTSDLSDVGLERLVADANSLVALAEVDPFNKPSEATGHNVGSELDLVDEKLTELDAAEAIKRARVAEQAAFAVDPRVNNGDGSTFARVKGQSALVTSGGFVGSFGGTWASISVVTVAEDQDGKKQRAGAWRAKRYADDLESVEVVGREAAAKTLAKLGARKIPTQEVAVIFDAEAGRSLLGLLANCVNGHSVWRRSSYLLGREDTQVANENITVIDDPLIVRGMGSRPFDGEGTLSRRNVVVDKGILRTYLLDGYSARKLSKTSTASAIRGGGGVSAGISNFILQPGNTSRQALFKDTARGLYVTDMMGFGFNAVTGDFSRGAAGFWIEDGEIKHPVAEVTISLNLDELLKRIDCVADDLDLRSTIATPTFRVSSMIVAGS